MKQLELHLPSVWISAIIVLSMVGMYCLGQWVADEVTTQPTLKEKKCREGYTRLIMIYPEYNERYNRCAKDEFNPLDQPKGRKR